MILTDNIYGKIAQGIKEHIDCDRFEGSGEVDIDKDRFVCYDFEGEGRMVNYYAEDRLTPCQYDMEAEITVNILYVTEDGAKAVEACALEKFFDKNIKIYS